MVAIGGWGDTEGFDVAAATESSRKLFAQNVNSMVEATGADGKPMTLTPAFGSLILQQALTLTGNTQG